MYAAVPDAADQSNLDRTRHVLDRAGIDLDAERVERYLRLLLRWNQRFNLTAASNYRELLQRHFLDSVQIAPWLQGDTVLDVGTGAGFPGIPLALMYPDRQFSLLDSNGKKCRFLQQAKTELRLDNVMIHQARIEQFEPAHFPDSVLSRAFAPLGRLCELCRPVTRPGTRLLCMKGRGLESELEQIPSDFRLDGVKSLPGATESGARLAILSRRPEGLEAS